MVQRHDNSYNSHVVADAAFRRLLQDRIWEIGQVHEIPHHGLGKLVEAEARPRPISHQKKNVTILSSELFYKWLDCSTSPLLFACAFSEDFGLAITNQVGPRIAHRRKTIRKRMRAKLRGQPCGFQTAPLPPNPPNSSD